MQPGHQQKQQIDLEILGMIYGFLGVLGFSLTLPATRVAVTELNPLIVGLGRAFVAAILAAALLKITRQPLPTHKQLPSLLVVVFGVVLGFPLLSAWAMQRLPAAHGAVILGLLPLATAIAGTIRTGDRPSWLFWLASTVGSVTVAIFGLVEGAGHLHLADLALLAAVIAAALGYAEGGRLARLIGGWQVISWALVLAAPFVAIPVAVAVLQHGLIASPTAWLGFVYVITISQFIAFFAWYQGLAIGGVARVGQLQLLQPFLTVFAAALLGEQINRLTIAATSIVVASVAIGRQAPIKRRWSVNHSPQPSNCSRFRQRENR